MDIRYILEISPQEQISFSLADTQEDMKYYLSGLILVSAYTLQKAMGRRNALTSLQACVWTKPDTFTENVRGITNFLKKGISAILYYIDKYIQLDFNVT